MIGKIYRWYKTIKWAKQISKGIAKQLDCESRPWFKLSIKKETKEKNV